NLALAVPLGSTPATELNVYNGGSLSLNTSVGGDADLTSRLFVANDGNVGIGTTTPLHSLSVNGTTNITGAVTLGSTLAVTSTITANTDETINGIDINAGAISD